MLRTVLIDDEYYFRNSLKRAIPWEQHGFEIIGDANNGRDALRLIVEEKPDLAIVDINMPIMTGLELIEKLREQGLTCKCILLTGHDAFQHAQKAVGLGVLEYILKPVNFDLLLESLQNVRKQVEREQAELLYVRTLEQEHQHLVRENFLKDLLLCQFFATPPNREDYLFQLGVQIRFNTFSVAVCTFSSPVLASALPALNMAMRILEAGQFEIVTMNPFEVCVIAEKWSSDTFSAIFQTPALQKLDGFTGLSATHNGMADLSLAYQEAVLCQRHKLTANSNFLRYEQISSTIQPLSGSFRQQFKQCLLQRDLCAIKQQINALFEQFAREKTSTDTLVVNILDLISMLFQNLGQSSATQNFAFQSTDSIVSLIQRAKSLELLQQDLWQLFEPLLQEQVETQSSVTLKVEQYLLAHYSESDLSINSIAQNLYLNYSYLCYCFKRDKQLTINEFLSQTRIQNACRLFDEGQQNIAHVAESVGYSDAGYFSKCFKKAIGVSPRQYVESRLCLT